MQITDLPHWQRQKRVVIERIHNDLARYTVPIFQIVLFAAVIYLPCFALVMVGGAIELMKVPGRGADGHIAIGTANVTRGAAFLERKGFALDYQSAVERDGRVKALFLKDEIAGFAVHLVER